MHSDIQQSISEVAMNTSSTAIISVKQLSTILDELEARLDAGDDDENR